MHPQVRAVFRRRLAELRLPSLGLQLQQVEDTLVGVPKVSEADGAAGEARVWVLITVSGSAEVIPLQGVVWQDTLQVTVANLPRERVEAALETVRSDTRAELEAATRQVLL